MHDTSAKMIELTYSEEIVDALDDVASLAVVQRMVQAFVSQGSNVAVQRSLAQRFENKQFALDHATRAVLETRARKRG